MRWYAGLQCPLCTGARGSRREGCDNISLSSVQAIEVLIELASLQTAFLTLDEAIKTTNRRVNALENVVCPKLDNTVAYIKARSAVDFVPSPPPHLHLRA